MIRTVKFTINFEDATLLEYAKRRGFVEGFVKNVDGTDSDVPLDPWEHIKNYWKNNMLTNINEFINQVAMEQMQAQTDALKIDAANKFTVEDSVE